MLIGERMNFKKMGALLLAAAVLVEAQLPEYNIGAVDEYFSCPADAALRPCRCTTLPPVPTVHCGGVRSLKTVHQALGHRFSGSPIPYLKILNCKFVGLPARAFANISITRLQIRDSNLRYVDAGAFEGLQSLLILVLHNVKLSTFPAESLSHLPSLVHLSLASNKLAMLTQGMLRGADALKYLNLADNHLSHVDRGAFPMSLVTLSLAHNFLASMNRSIRNLVNLEWLVVAGNRIVSIEGELEELYNLRHLNLGNNLIRTLGSSLSNLQHLKFLELQYNNINELGTSLRNLSQLKGLNLSMNIYLRLEYDVFEGLSSLENLDLSGNHLSDLNSALLPLMQLVTLDLSKNSLTSFSFHEISTLSKLHLLDLNDNLLIFLEPEPAAPCSVPIASFLLARNNLTSMSGFLRHFPSLEEIDVSVNRISRIRASDYSVVPSLTYVNIEGNPLICDAEQMNVYHQLRNLNIEMDGEPRCSADPAAL